MRKKLNNPWVVGALASAAILPLILQLRAGSDDRVVVAAGAGDSAPVALEAGGGSPVPGLDSVTAPPALGRAHLRDPFALRLEAIATPTISATVRLSGIWTENGATLVLINDEIHKAGDDIGPLTVESASDEGVWILHDKARAFLALGQTRTFNVPAASAPERPL
jgi:hypothetical protein